MNQIESYLFLFADSFFTNLALNANSELAINVMKVFGTYNLQLVFIIALLGAICGGAVNYLLGRVGYNLYRFSTDQVLQLRYGNLVQIFDKYGCYLLLIVALQPIGRFVVIVAGFTKFGIKRTIFYVFIAKFLYYAYILYL